MEKQAVCQKARGEPPSAQLFGLVGGRNLAEEAEEAEQVEQVSPLAQH